MTCDSMLRILALFAWLIPCHANLAKVDGLRVSYNVEFLSRQCLGDDFALLNTVRVSLDQCVVECARRPACKALEYRRKFQWCRLLDTGKSGPFPENAGDCTMVKKSDMNILNLPDECKSCRYGESCNLGKEVCEKTECPKIKLPNGELKGNMNQIGARAKFSCSGGYENPHDPEVITTCQQNGTWSIAPKCLPNVAQKKPTNMSATTGDSSSAVDGSGGVNCFQIEAVGSLNPWWQVDLLEIHRIFLIKVFWPAWCVNNGCAFSDILLSIGMSTDSLNFERYVQDKTGNLQIFRFPNGIHGRVIRLILNSTLCNANTGKFGLRDVQVFAEKATIDSDCTSDNECIETGGQCLSGKCSCSDFFRFNTTINDCIQVTIGSNCASNRDCLETGGQCLSGQCSCNEPSRFSTTLNECVNATIGSDCTSDTECIETGGQCLFGKCYCNKFSRFNTSVNDCVQDTVIVKSEYPSSCFLRFIEKRQVGHIFYNFYTRQRFGTSFTNCFYQTCIKQPPKAMTESGCLTQVAVKTVCANMTAEFDKYINTTIIDHNNLDHVIVNTADECLQKCIANETCLSFETKHESENRYICSMCSLSYKMVLDAEQYLINRESENKLYSRICE